MPATTRIPEFTRIPENRATTIFSGIRVGICSPSYYLVHDEIPLAMASSAAAVKGRFR